MAPKERPAGPEIVKESNDGRGVQPPILLSERRRC